MNEFGCQEAQEEDHEAQAEEAVEEGALQEEPLAVSSYLDIVAVPSMDKEDCIQELLSTLQKPQWKGSSSVTDWDLKSILWQGGILLTPDQMAALLADIKRRGLIACRERRGDSRVVAMWGVRLAPAGEEWLAQRAQAVASTGQRCPESPSPTANSIAGEAQTEPAPDQSGDPREPAEAGSRAESICIDAQPR